MAPNSMNYQTPLTKITFIQRSWAYVVLSSKSQTVHLIHFSAVDFLTGQQHSGPFSEPMLQNYYLALDCLKYLDHEDSWHLKDDEGRNIIYKRSFSQYVVAAWYEHLIRTQQYRHQIQPQLMSFFHVPNPNWDNWRQQYEASQATPSGSSGSEGDDPPVRIVPGGRMYYAALFGLREVAEYLHNREMAGIDDVGGFYGNPVQAASRNGNIDALVFLMGHVYQSPMMQDPKKTGFTPLHSAVRLGNIKMVKVLLQNGADYSVATEDGNTPLHISALHGHTEIFKLLLDAGADAKSTNSHGSTALHYGAFGRHVEICQLLLGVGADHTVADKKWFNCSTCCS
ncbi:ankyrin repeat-containing domain protein [Aspergillus cavernicola]|uniref:Ankyrin repeat-containing domain protein n=1 Tax=Aspergillus cavernicola TaxID=176166 RepID=A0ABR4I024_9EURO